MLVPEVSELEHDGSGFKEPKSAYDEASASSRGNSQVRDGTPCANYIAPATTFAPSDNHWIYCLVSCAAIPEASLQRIVGVHLISETCDGEFWGLLASTRGVCALISRRIYPWPGSTRKYDLWQPTMKEAFGRFEDEARTIARGRYNATAFHGVVKHGTPVFHYYRQLCPYHVIATGLFIFRLRQLSDTRALDLAQAFVVAATAQLPPNSEDPSIDYLSSLDARGLIGAVCGFLRARVDNPNVLHHIAAINLLSASLGPQIDESIEGVLPDQSVVKNRLLFSELFGIEKLCSWEYCPDPTGSLEQWMVFDDTCMTRIDRLFAIALEDARLSIPLSPGFYRGMRERLPYSELSGLNTLADTVEVLIPSLITSPEWELMVFLLWGRVSCYPEILNWLLGSTHSIQALKSQFKQTYEVNTFVVTLLVLARYEGLRHPEASCRRNCSFTDVEAYLKGEPCCPGILDHVVTAACSFPSRLCGTRPLTELMRSTQEHCQRDGIVHLEQSIGVYTEERLINCQDHCEAFMEAARLGPN